MKINQEFDEIDIFILDGNYTNRFDIIQFVEPLDFHPQETEDENNAVKAHLESVEIQVVSFQNWSPTLKFKNCRVDVDLEFTFEEILDQNRQILNQKLVIE